MLGVPGWAAWAGRLDWPDGTRGWGGRAGEDKGAGTLEGWFGVWDRAGGRLVIWLGIGAAIWGADFDGDGDWFWWGRRCPL